MRKLTVILGLTGMVLAFGLNALTQPREIVLRIQEPKVPYAASRIDQKLVTMLSRDQSIRVTLVDGTDTTLASFPTARYDLDSLASWGNEIGGRFLLSVVVHDQRLERRKSFHIPILFHKWEAVGVVEGEIRLVDLLRNKQLVAEPFTTTLSAKRVFQGTMDDHKYDPDIHLTASEKIRFFDKLQTAAAEKIIEETRRYMGVR